MGTRRLNLSTVAFVVTASTIRLMSLARSLLFLPSFTKCLEASTTKTSLDSRCLRSTMMMVGMPVPKKMLAGRPMMAWIWRYSTKFFRMVPSSPPRNSTPYGKTMHMMPSGRRWYRSCSKKA